MERPTTRPDTRDLTQKGSGAGWLPTHRDQWSRCIPDAGAWPRMDADLLRQAIPIAPTHTSTAGYPPRAPGFSATPSWALRTERLFGLSRRARGATRQLRAAVVKASALAEVARTIWVPSYCWARARRTADRTSPRSWLTRWTVIGAMYMSTDLETTRTFIERRRPLDRRIITTRRWTD